MPARPRPIAPPVYQEGPTKLGQRASRRWKIVDYIDIAFFAAAGAAILWLAGVLLLSGFQARSWWDVLNIVAFWAVLAYLALPRFHQVMTWAYVPDYFIGRTRTGDGVLGDPINLGVRGSANQIHRAMQAAGWTLADPITARSAMRIVTSSVFRKSYPEAPVSNLYLFGNKQAFAYQKEVEGNPAQRHHVRFWPVPEGWVLPGGHRCDWLAAGTYDRAVGISAFTLQVTHKIDADIDIERNYICDSVRYENEQADLVVLRDFSTAYHHKNGGGDAVLTDGDLHVLELQELADSPKELLLPPDETGANRRRPPSLIFAVFAVLLATGQSALQLFLVELPRIKADQSLIQGDQDLVSLMVALAIVISAILTIGVLAFAVATWLGHPRGRIGLMVLLLLTVINDANAIHQLEQVGMGQLVTFALSVLTLLALTSRACHAWVDGVATDRLLIPSADSQPETGAQDS